MGSRTEGEMGHYSPHGEKKIGVWWPESGCERAGCGTADGVRTHFSFILVCPFS